jgi:uncharacterized protein YciI
MYLLNISYTQPVESVHPHAAAHKAWVKKHIDEGAFLFAGPKASGLGGVIVTRAIPREQLKAMVSEDSFVKAEVADIEIIDFNCTVVAQSITGLLS